MVLSTLQCQPRPYGAVSAPRRQGAGQGQRAGQGQGQEKNLIVAIPTPGQHVVGAVARENSYTIVMGFVTCVREVYITLRGY